jgi:hypothetical protein
MLKTTDTWCRRRLNNYSTRINWTSVKTTYGRPSWVTHNCTTFCVGMTSMITGDKWQYTSKSYNKFNRIRRDKVCTKLLNYQDWLWNLTVNGIVRYQHSHKNTTQSQHIHFVFVKYEVISYINIYDWQNSQKSYFHVNKKKPFLSISRNWNVGYVILIKVK